MLRRVFASARRPFLVAMGIGAAVIAHASVVYFDDEELPPFVIEKLPLPLEDLWFLALRIHVVVALFSLPACLLLMSRRVQRGRPRVHRYLGRITGVVVLLGLVPSGLYLSWFAKGGLISTLGFALSGVIVAVAMVEAVRAARARDFTRHARFTRHVVAQLSVAVLSRAMMMAFDAVGVEQTLAYLVSLWLPVLTSVVFVELLHKPKTHRSTHVPHTRLDDFHPDFRGIRNAAGR
jgi:Predicted membrane protein (DUF2306)